MNAFGLAGWFVAGLVAGWFLFSCGASAHTPCDDSYVEQAPNCHYVQAVNPITGKLEQHYVCT